MDYLKPSLTLFQFQAPKLNCFTNLKTLTKPRYCFVSEVVKL